MQTVEVTAAQSAMSTDALLQQAIDALGVTLEARTVPRWQGVTVLEESLARSGWYLRTRTMLTSAGKARILVEATHGCEVFLASGRTEVEAKALAALTIADLMRRAA